MWIFSKHSRSSFPKGFTLIELLVVAAVILVITVFILFRQSKFNSSTLLRSLTYSMALSVRQAQVYGTSVRESSTGSGIFAPGYGVYFPPSLPDQYYIFADSQPSPLGNGAYDTGEELPKFTLGRGYTVSNLCAHRTTGERDCQSEGEINTLTIFFRRPNPDACFSTNAYPGACAVGAEAPYDSAYVQMRADGVDTRSIKITSTGQIAVCAPNTDITAESVKC